MLDNSCFVVGQGQTEVHGRVVTLDTDIRPPTDLAESRPNDTYRMIKRQHVCCRAERLRYKLETKYGRTFCCHSSFHRAQCRLTGWHTSTPSDLSEEPQPRPQKCKCQSLSSLTQKHGLPTACTQGGRQSHNLDLLAVTEPQPADLLRPSTNVPAKRWQQKKSRCMA